MKKYYIALLFLITTLCISTNVMAAQIVLYTAEGKPVIYTDANKASQDLLSGIVGAIKKERYNLVDSQGNPTYAIEGDRLVEALKQGHFLESPDQTEKNKQLLKSRENNKPMTEQEIYILIGLAGIILITIICRYWNYIKTAIGYTVIFGGLFIVLLLFLWLFSSIASLITPIGVIIILLFNNIIIKI